MTLLVALYLQFGRGGRMPNSPALHLPTRPPSPATGGWAASSSTV